MLEKGVVLRGVCHFFSETGTEGGDWAFQDENFISRVAPPYGVWEGQKVWDASHPERRGIAQEGAELLRDGEWVPLRDPMTEDPDYTISSLFCGESRGNREADRRLMEKYGFKIKYWADRMNERYGEGNWHFEDSSMSIGISPDGSRIGSGGTPSTEPNRPYGVGPGGLTRVNIAWDDGTTELRLSDSLLVSSWSYEGLHCLENGDHLTIYSNENPEKIVWQGTIRLKQYDSFTEHAFNFWIHADQVGMERETWAKWFFDGNPAVLVVNEFREFLREALRKDPKLKWKIAEVYEVAPSTVGRWASGTANPHPRLKEKVREFISLTQQ